MFIASLNVVLCSWVLSVVRVLFECSECCSSVVRVFSSVVCPFLAKLWGLGQKFARAAEGGACKGNVACWRRFRNCSWSSDALLSSLVHSSNQILVNTYQKWVFCSHGGCSTAPGHLFVHHPALSVQLCLFTAVTVQLCLFTCSSVCLLFMNNS